MIIALLLLISLALNLTGCTLPVRAENLMDGVDPKYVSTLGDLSSDNARVTDFGIRLFGATHENGRNTLISPLSVLCALAMTANGAEGETLEQMETVLGMSRNELNLYLYSYMSSLSRGDRYKLSLANSIWFRDDPAFNVNPSFLQTNADYYGADIYKSPFDRQTLWDVNNWVKDKTDGMIPKILDKIPDETVMYLINALAFEAQWSSIYETNQVRDGKFTKEDGTKQNVELMYDSVGVYLEDDLATGFIKSYSGGKYAFAALLPKAGVTVDEYVSSLDGSHLNALLSEPEYVTVNTAIPKFENEFESEMSQILKSMGMTEAFMPTSADFTSLGTWSGENIYIGRVIHKTYIQVGERGTKAGAVTVVGMDKCAGSDPGEIKQVYLDRPFVYMLIDCENNIPFFIGTLMNVNN